MTVGQGFSTKIEMMFGPTMSSIAGVSWLAETLGEFLDYHQEGQNAEFLLLIIENY